MEYFIGIDIGTSSTKTAAFDLKGSVLQVQQQSYPLYTPAPGHHEQKPEEIFLAVQKTIQQLVEQMGTQPLGLSISSAMHSLIALDASGEPLTNSITWADKRAMRYALDLKGTMLGSAFYRSTGVPIHPMAPLFKIAWIRDHKPDLFKKTARFVDIKGYILYRLFGKLLIDYSIASATGMFDIHKLQWHGDALNYAGVTSKQLPDLVPATHKLTGLDSEQAKAMKLDPSRPWIIGSSDGCLANLGVCALQSDELVLTIGTSGAIRLSSQEPLIDQQERIFSYVLEDGFYVSGGATNNGGVAFDWFQNNFSATIPDIESIPPGAEGLIFLPYILGERAPIWEANARGSYFGIQKRHTQAHFLRATLEGIILNIKAIQNALTDHQAQINGIHASGGFTNSRPWMQLTADILGSPLWVHESPQASAKGAAFLGMKALGYISDYRDIIMDPPQETIVPNQEHEAAYKKAFDRFSHLNDSLWPIWDKLNEELDY